MKKKIAWVTGITVVVLAIVFLLGPKPKAPVYKDQLPEVPEQLTALEQFVQERERQYPVRYDNQARILWYDSVPRVTDYSFLYLHGFAGSYRDGYPLNHIIAHRYAGNLYFGRMAGHGLIPSRALVNFTPETAWERALEDFAIARQLGRKLIIISTSTGGTLALKLAATFPEEVSGLINISPNIRDGQLGASLLNTPWGDELATVVFMGDKRTLEHEQDSASLYWDTLYPVAALRQLQKLVETTMIETTYRQITCPVLTLYYYENYLEKDWRVDVDMFPVVHRHLGTSDNRHRLVALEEPGTHFIGSSIKSQNYRHAADTIYRFCDRVLGMNTVNQAAATPGSR